jgi:hypothetical protein
MFLIQKRHEGPIKDKEDSLQNSPKIWKGHFIVLGTRLTMWTVLLVFNEMDKRRFHMFGVIKGLIQGTRVRTCETSDPEVLKWLKMTKIAL